MGITTHATVILTVEIPVRSGWGKDCATEQVYKQASEEALELVRKHYLDTHMRVVGPIKVKAITQEVE